MMRKLAVCCSLLLLASVAGLSLAASPRLPRIIVWKTELQETEETELRAPIAVAAASNDEVAVADAFGPKLLVFRRTALDWKLEADVDLPGTPVALIHDGRRYVASIRGQTGLLTFEGPQLLQRRIALPRGVVPGVIAAFGDGRLLVYDLDRERLLQLAPDGKLADTFDLDGRVSALATTPGGDFLAAVGERSTVSRYDPQGRQNATWNLPSQGPVPAWPVGLAVEPGGDVLVVDRPNSRILVLDVAGEPIGIGSRRGWEPGLLWFPRAMVRLPGGDLVVADEANGRAQIFRRSDDGQPQ